MSAYVAESDRQIRVYGSSSSVNGHGNPQTPNNNNTRSLPNDPSNGPSTQQQGSSAGGNNNSSSNNVNNNTPRGIAAIPLLCAAASESRPAYLRRLSRTTLETSWWSRQEPLCAVPGTFWSLPETLLLASASLVEYASLTVAETSPALQSFLWPLHNCFLACWMLVILLYTLMGGAFSLVATLLWGSVRTGLSLSVVWREELRPAAVAVHTLCQTHQRISVRLVGLLLLPSTTLLEGLCDGIVLNLLGGGGTTTTTTTGGGGANANSGAGATGPSTASGGLPLLASSLVYCLVMLGLTWWYWTLTAPFLAFLMLCTAFWIGWCFALIELAGV